MPPSMPILAAYDEIALKSRFVRSTLEKRLAAQIRARTAPGGLPGEGKEAVR